MRTQKINRCAYQWKTILKQEQEIIFKRKNSQSLHPSVLLRNYTPDSFTVTLPLFHKLWYKMLWGRGRVDDFLKNISVTT